jgi:methylmalonyl-CoA mutase cobalamin-binding subunit
MDLPPSSAALSRAAILPETDLPEGAAALAAGRALAREAQVGPCPYLADHGARSEIEVKRRAMAEGRVTLHAQIGWRDPGKTREAWRAIHAATDKAGQAVERYGICLDWSMGYPKAERARFGKGTGLILEEAADFAALTRAAPVAPHFGDFMIGLPAAVENTVAALAAGATTLGNLGQYFTFRMPGWPEDLETTRATVEALALCAAQPVEILIHSNLDDGFAALFHDLACAFGAALLERHLVEELIGGRIGHCYGHTFAEPLSRLAFQRALARGRSAGPDAIPGTMVYGNTTAYREKVPEAFNYARLGRYLGLDIAAQRLLPSGHAVNPVPVTEAERIPDVDEVIDAQLFALSLIDADAETEAAELALDLAAADALADRLVAGGTAFRDAVLAGLAGAGLRTDDPLELLLALRRVGPKRLEELYGPGVPDPAAPRGRQPTVVAPPVKELARLAARTVGGLSAAERTRLAAAGLSVCVAATDVHEYGKLLVETALGEAGVRPLDGGVHAEPERLVAQAKEAGASAIAISTYNGIALDYLRAVRRAADDAGLRVPLFVGGKLNQVPAESNSGLPVDVRSELRAAGAVPLDDVESLLRALAERCA